jgi:hypothetical protein
MSRVTRFTPKVHVELRDAVAVAVDDRDALEQYDLADAAAIDSLHAKLAAATPGAPIELTAAEVDTARSYLLDLADVVDGNADMHGEITDPVSAREKMARAERAYATRLRRVAADLQL